MQYKYNAIDIEIFPVFVRYQISPIQTPHFICANSNTNLRIDSNKKSSSVKPDGRMYERTNVRTPEHPNERTNERTSKRTNRRTGPDNGISSPAPGQRESVCSKDSSKWKQLRHYSCFAFIILWKKPTSFKSQNFTFLFSKPTGSAQVKMFVFVFLPSNGFFVYTEKKTSRLLQIKMP